MISSTVLQSPLDLFAGAGQQRALLAVLALAVIGAALGWAIVLRDLPFFTHATGAGSYPLLVLGAIWGLSAGVSSLIGALAFALVLTLLGVRGRGERRSRQFERRDSLIGIIVVAALASGTLIAEGTSKPVPEPEAMLFGSLHAIDPTALGVILGCTLVVVALALSFAPYWLATGFDPLADQAGATRGDAALLLAVAVGVGAAVPLTGSLLAGALLILPAASVRMFARRAPQIAPWTLLLASTEGAFGLYFALNFDLPAGATIAAVSGTTFFACAAVRKLRAPSVRGARVAALATALVLAAAVLGGCGGGAKQAADDQPLKVVATTPQVADIVRHVGGEAVSVETLLGPNLDPHEYDATPTDVARVRAADVVFRSGGATDDWILRVSRQAGSTSPPVDLSRSVVLIPGPGTAINPHWYLAPQNVARAAQKTRDELIKAAPSSRETFRTNTGEYLDEIDRSERAIRRCAARVPQAALFAEHNEFDYLAGAFGLRIVSVISPDGTGEPSARQIGRAQARAKARGARAMIASTGEISRVEQRLAEQLGIPLLALYGDNLTTRDQPSTLIGAIAYNIAHIADAVTSSSTTCGALR